MNKANKTIKKRGLGKGLEALLGDSASALDTKSANTLILPIEHLTPNPYQPRTVFNDTAIAELAESIQQHGIIQPLAVRLIENKQTRDDNKTTAKYEIIAGERRFRAAQIAGLTELPVIIHDISDTDSAVFALIENLQREDLNAIEKAHGIKRLITNFKLTHEACGKVLGQSRSAISNTLRLLELSEPVQTALMEKRIDMGHARALIAIDRAEQEALLQKVLLNGLSVRETEALIRHQSTTEPTKQKRATKSSFVKQTEVQLSEHLQTKVNISQQASGNGKVTVAFSDEKTLQALLKKLGLNIEK